MPSSGNPASAEWLDRATRLTPIFRKKSFERMALQRGQRVLDVGCGTGDDSRALALELGRSGVVHGVDYNAVMVALAGQRICPGDDAAVVTFHHANVAALPWPDDYFNASRSDRVFQQMLDPEHAFDEMLRVTQPDGRLVVIDGDWATLSIDSDEPDIDDWFAHFETSLLKNSQNSGEALHRLFSSRGLLGIQVEVLPLFRSDAETTWCWRQSRSTGAAAAGLFGSANVVVISGFKPQFGAASGRLV